MSRKRIANILKVKRNNKQINMKYMKKETSGFSILSLPHLQLALPKKYFCSEIIFLFWRILKITISITFSEH